jgi:hypothetical protein
MLIAGSGVGLALPAFTIAATATLAPQKLATGIGAQTMFRQIGSSLGVAAFVAILGTPTVSTGSRRPCPRPHPTPTPRLPTHTRQHGRHAELGRRLDQHPTR